MKQMLKMYKNKFKLIQLLFLISSLYFLTSFEPYSFFTIIKDTLFADYQKIQILELDAVLTSSLIFYILICIYSKVSGEFSRLILFLVLYDSFETFKGWSENYFTHIIYLAFALYLLFNFSSKRIEFKDLIYKNWFNYFFIFLIVLFKTPPFTSGWSPSEWFKIARGYFGIFVGRNEHSAFMTPNSPRSFLYDFVTGGIINLLGIEFGYFLIKFFSILLVSYALYKLLNSLNLGVLEQLLVLSIFVLNQDLIGGNVVIGIFEDDRFATSFSLLAISSWLTNRYKQYSIFTLLSIFTHIQIGLFWFGFVSVFELFKRNKSYLKHIRNILLFSLPVIIPTANEFLFGKNELVYAFNKTSSWVYAFIFQAYHVAPFEVDGIVFNDFLLRNWSRGFTNVLIFCLVSIYLYKFTKHEKLKYFVVFFTIYFPTALLLLFLDSKLSNPGQLSSLFLFRYDTVFYLIILSLCVSNLRNKLDPSLVTIYVLIISFGLINVYSSQANKYNSIDQKLQRTEKVLEQLSPEFILIEPNVELYTGSIELRTNIPTYVSQKYITNSLSNFPEWYEKLELRGRFFQGECELFFDKNLEYFLGRENNSIKCGELIYPNGDYSIFKIPEIKGFNLPTFNSSCEYTKEEGEKILIEERIKSNLNFKIETIYEESILDCSGKIIGTNLDQGLFVDQEIEKIVLVVDK